jgi:channel protein (hemolysin III family)
VPLYLLLDYAAIWFAGALLHGAGLTVVALLIAGGVLYNIGAILYGLRWPNPWPESFSHHRCERLDGASLCQERLCSSVVWWLLAGPGSDLSEESACGV